MTDDIEIPDEELTEEEAVTPDDIAEQVAAIHQQLDQFKDWSNTISEWLDSERKRLRDEGDLAGAAQTLRLIQHVESVALRIEMGDANMRPPTPEPSEGEDSEGDEDEDTTV